MEASEKPDRAVAQMARGQAGVFSGRQAFDAGFTKRQIQNRVGTGAWLRFLPSLYVLPSAPVTWTTWAWAGLLTGGSNSSLIGGSAAAARGWLAPQWPITLAVSVNSRPSWPRGRLKPCNLLVPPADIVSINGLTVTIRLRTAVDVAHFLPAPTAQDLIDRLLVRDVIDLESLNQAVESSTRYGSKQARQLVRQAADLAASHAERLCHRVLRSASLTNFEANVVVAGIDGSYKVDLAFINERVVIEIQGWAFHQDPDQRRADDAKAIDLQLAGWVVIRLTWQDLTSRPAWVVGTVRAALTRR